MKNYNIRLAALSVAAGTIITMSGCGSSNIKNNSNVSSSDISTRQSILEGSILENTFVADVDGHITILRREMTTNANWGCSEHECYRDIVNGDLMSTHYERCHEFIQECKKITKLGNIEDYLTEEQMQKAYNGELTDDDIVSIVMYAHEKAEEQKEEIEQKTKTK